MFCFDVAIAPLYAKNDETKRAMCTGLRNFVRCAMGAGAGVQDIEAGGGGLTTNQAKNEIYTNLLKYIFLVVSRSWANDS